MRGRDLSNRNGARQPSTGPVRFKRVKVSNRSLGKPQRSNNQRPSKDKSSNSRSAHKRPSRHDRNRERIDFEQRKKQTLDDISTFRVASYSDVIEERFGGNAFAASRGVDALKKEGLVMVHTVRFKSGKSFRVLFATEAGRKQAWSKRSNDQQRYWSGIANPAEVRHDSAIYRATRNEIAKLEKQGASIKRIELDYEMKSRVAKIAEKARAEEGDEAAFLTRIEMAKKMNLPTTPEGNIKYPDARIEYQNEQGEAGRVDVEVTSDNYRNQSLQSKAAAGFKMYANGSKAASRMSYALGLGDPSGGGGGGGSPRDDLFEL